MLQNETIQHNQKRHDYEENIEQLMKEIAVLQNKSVQLNVVIQSNVANNQQERKNYNKTLEKSRNTLLPCRRNVYG